MEHSETCQIRFAKHEEAIHAYTTQYPNYCRKCNGWGVVSWTENQAPLGSGQNWPMEMSDPCTCVEEGKCPRCGEKAINLTEEGDFPPDGIPACSACGWRDGEPSTAGISPDYECDCWYEEEKRMFEEVDE